MTDEMMSDPVAPMDPLVLQLAEALVAESGGRAEVIRDDQQHWLAIEEIASTIAFVEAEGDELRIVPFVGDAEVALDRAFVESLRPSWLDGAQEVVVRVSAITDEVNRGEVLGYLRAALDHWVRSTEPSDPLLSPIVPEPPSTVDASDVDFTASEGSEEAGSGSAADELRIGAQMRADISDEWSWASSVAKIPQITDLTISLSEPIEHARISITLADADEKFGSTTLDVGAISAGTATLRPLHVPLSARAMSQVEERRGAECLIQLEDAVTGQVYGRYSEEADIQPRDLWFWKGDPHRAEQRQRLVREGQEQLARLEQDPEGPGAEAIKQELDRLSGAIESATAGSTLSRCLLASFVRPNHPEVAALAREAATLLGAATGDSGFQAFQFPDPGAVEERVEATIDAICNAIAARRFAYSDPPPGWDYSTAGQRIRDHGDVARGGLATCMDSTVLTAAVMEHVGMYPVLVMVQGHIFVGYWRRDPSERPDWYPDRPVVGLGEDPAAIAEDSKLLANLVEGRYLGFVESTALADGSDVTPQGLKNMGLGNFWQHLQSDYVILIDVLAARRASVSPLPAINNRADGVTEIIEYRPGGVQPVVETVQPDDSAPGQRQVDNHPARYRTWKSSLFSLNATNDLLNLKRNAKVQPLALPREGLGILEDRLNQDKSFSLLSGYEIPEVWQARGIKNALQMLDSADPDDKQGLLRQLEDRKVFIQRVGRDGTAFAPVTFVKELRSMANGAKTAKDERGMNPLYLCLGLLRWPYKPGVFAEAPLILVPVNIAVARGRQEFVLSLDSSQQTTPNAALIEWLRHEHGLSIPGLAEPLADRAGIDVDGVLTEVRKAVADRGLPFDIAAEARLATLDLSAFRMWQDLNTNGDSFIDRPLIRHLVESPTEQFEDPAIEAAGAAATDEAMVDELEKLDTPIPADSTQKRAVLWARQGRTFVLQGPPGTGKSQTITNMVGECVMSGMRVLFVAEKGTALAVVQRRLDAIGLGPFTLNLHHEGSNASEVRASLKRALAASVTPDSIAMESARRRLRNARFELMQYPQHLHEPNAAGLSAYSAHDELLVLGNGPTMPVPAQVVAHQAEKIDSLRELFENLQQWTAAAGVRPDHPWRLAGVGSGEPFDLDAVSRALTGVLDGTAWATAATGALHEALDAIVHPKQLNDLAAAANRVLPDGDDLAGVLSAQWPAAASETVFGCERSVEGWSAKLHGFPPDIVGLDLRAIATQLQEATAGGMFGRGKRQTAAIAPLIAMSPPGMDLQPTAASAILSDLIAAQDAGASIRSALAAVPGIGSAVPTNPFRPGALEPVRVRFDELLQATAGLRDGGEWIQRVHSLAQAGHLSNDGDSLAAFAHAWQECWESLVINEADLEAWRGDHTLLAATDAVSTAWRRQVDFDRLLPLQNWCTLVRKLEPLLNAGLESARVELLEGRLPAYVAEDALARGVAQASLDERVSTAGLDRFNSVAHDQRITTYSEAQAEVRTQWATDGPAILLERRGSGGVGNHTGGLARELEKTTRKLGTRPILRKYGAAVQELTPLVLCSPSSVVDLIEPGVMEFDVVIFDEASQITVPEAVGALGRARSAIVVGDSKQMPPTRTVGGGPAGDEEVDDPDVEEIVEDQESILSECELARVPTLSLNWHYRSQDEALIAFSNRTYYRGDLSSFPTPTLLSSETGLDFRPVHWPENDDKGMYLRAGAGKVDLGNGIVSGSNTNRFEAVEIVKYVHDLVHASPILPSVGIVTFNEQQRQLIEDLLHASDDPQVSDVLDESKMGRGEALFVKALEQVQGDERDIIIFSIAFSKQANGKVPTSFGPLSNAGGERRLNVAVTRARRKNVVFCSFNPSSNELDVAGSTYQGPKDLKQFLIDAQAAGSQTEQSEPAHRIALRDRHRDDIAAALRGVGLHVMSDVGLSNFRLDLVIARPESPTHPILPILLDGESWRKRHTVSDRDVLPLEVLQNLMGWPTVARIWWPMWLQNRQEVIDGILAAVDRAEATLDGKTIAADPTPADASPDDQAASTIVDPTPTPTPDSEFDGAVSFSPMPTDEANFYPPPDDEPARFEPSYTIPTPAEPVAPPPVPSPAAELDRSSPIEESPESVPSEPAVSQSGSHAVERSADPITEFVPAHANVIGLKDVLDALPDRKAAAAVREQVIDVIEAEGPIETSRLARIVARRFGLNAVRAARAEDITKLIPRSQLRKSRKFGHFAWPVGLDPETWSGFRTADKDLTRTFDEIASEEIANAMLAVLEEYPDLEYVDDVLRRTAELFGMSKLGAKIRVRLEAVYATLPDEPSEDDGPQIPQEVLDPVAPTVETPNWTPAQQSEVAPHVRDQGAQPASRPRDPVVDQIVGEVAAYVPDLSRVPSEFYYDYATDRPMAADLRHLINAIVVDSEYAGSQGHKGVATWTQALSVDDAHAVGNLASLLWSQSYGEAWAHAAERIALHLASDPEFEPLPWYEDINLFVASRMDGIRPGLVAVVQNQLNLYAHAKGLVARLEEEFQREARAALAAMPPLDRDIYGFTSRNAKRLQLAEPFISHVKGSHRRFVVYWMSRFEGDENALKREARYATAVRALAAQGETRAAISRTLGISTSIMDRVERENRRDVVLTADDPILIDLAPSLC